MSSYSMTPIRTSDDISQQTLPSLSGMNKTPNAESTQLSQQISDVTGKASLTEQQLIAYYTEQTTKKLVQEVMSEALKEEQNDQEEIKKERLLAEQERQRVNEEKLIAVRSRSYS